MKYRDLRPGDVLYYNDLKMAIMVLEIHPHNEVLKFTYLTLFGHVDGWEKIDHLTCSWDADLRAKCAVWRHSDR